MTICNVELNYSINDHKLTKLMFWHFLNNDQSKSHNAH